MVSTLTSSAVNHGIKSKSGETIDYEIGMICSSSKHKAKEKEQRLGQLRIRIKYPS